MASDEKIAKFRFRSESIGGGVTRFTIEQPRLDTPLLEYEGPRARAAIAHYIASSHHGMMRNANPDLAAACLETWMTHGVLLPAHDTSSRLVRCDTCGREYVLVFDSRDYKACCDDPRLRYL